MKYKFSIVIQDCTVTEYYLVKVVFAAQTHASLILGTRLSKIPLNNLKVRVQSLRLLYRGLCDISLLIHTYGHCCK